MRLKLDIVTPTRSVVSAQVDEVVAPSPKGEFGVLLGHTPFLTLLGIGEVRYRVGQRLERLALAGGFAEIGHSHVTILADACERPDEIDLERAQAARARAEKRLGGDTTEIDHAKADAALRRAQNRIQMASSGQRQRPAEGGKH